MGKKILIIGCSLSALIIIGILPIFLAGQIEHHLQRLFSNPLQQQTWRKQGIVLRLQDYRRGYFTSSAQVQVTFRPPHNAEKALLDTLLSVKIAHAPLLFSGIYPVSAYAESSNTQGWLADMLPVRQLFLQASVNWTGKINAIIQLPPSSSPLLNSQGAEIQWHSSLNNPAAGNGMLTIAKQELSTATGTFVFSPAQVQLWRKKSGAWLLRTEHLAVSARNSNRQQQYALYGEHVQGQVDTSSGVVLDANTVAWDKAGFYLRLQQLQATWHFSAEKNTIEIRALPESDLPLLKSINRDNLQIQYNLLSGLLTGKSQSNHDIHLSFQSYCPLPLPENIQGILWLNPQFAINSGLLPILQYRLGKISPDAQGNYPLPFTINHTALYIRQTAVLTWDK